MGHHLLVIYRGIERNGFCGTSIAEYNGYYSVVADNIREERSV